LTVRSLPVRRLPVGLTVLRLSIGLLAVHRLPVAGLPVRLLWAGLAVVRLRGGSAVPLLGVLVLRSALVRWRCWSGQRRSVLRVRCGWRCRWRPCRARARTIIPDGAGTTERR